MSFEKALSFEKRKLELTQEGWETELLIAGSYIKNKLHSTDRFMARYNLVCGGERLRYKLRVYNNFPSDFRTNFYNIVHNVNDDWQSNNNR